VKFVQSLLQFLERLICCPILCLYLNYFVEHSHCFFEGLIVAILQEAPSQSVLDCFPLRNQFIVTRDDLFFLPDLLLQYLALFYKRLLVREIVVDAEATKETSDQSPRK